jgi:uncharacterized membrane protein
MISYYIENILAKAPKKSVFGICVSFLITDFITQKICSISRLGESLGGGFVDSNVYSLYVSFHTNILIRKIVTIKNGRRSIPIGHHYSRG